jgi:hypothetical protein
MFYLCMKHVITMMSMVWPIAKSYDDSHSQIAQTTGRKKGFHSPPLVPNLFDPRLKGPSVPVHLKMWVRGH